MDQRSYGFISSAVFLAVAAAHLARLIAGWELTIAGWTAPYWISVPGLAVSGFLAGWGFVLASRTKSTT